MRARVRIILAAGLLALSACESTGTPTRARGDRARTSDTSAATLVPSSTPASTPRSTAPSVSTTPALPPGDDATVTREVDGDTIVVGGATRVRLIGINTPETHDPRKPVECFGREAAQHTATLVPPGTRVRLVYDVERLDRYGRTLAYVYRASDGLFVNAALVVDGYAEAYTYPPNVAHADSFVALARAAREAGRGLWGACGGVGGPAPTPSPADVRCDPSYPGVCIPPPPPDLDCPEVSFRRFQVLPRDPHGFDRDGDGIGCEAS